MRYHVQLAASYRSHRCCCRWDWIVCESLLSIVDSVGDMSRNLINDEIPAINFRGTGLGWDHVTNIPKSSAPRPGPHHWGNTIKHHGIGGGRRHRDKTSHPLLNIHTRLPRVPPRCLNPRRWQHPSRHRFPPRLCFTASP